MLSSDRVAAPGWHGRAATAYTDLVGRRAQAWQGLQADAERVAAVLRNDLHPTDLTRREPAPANPDRQSPDTAVDATDTPG